MVGLLGCLPFRLVPVFLVPVCRPAAGQLEPIIDAILRRLVSLEVVVKCQQREREVSVKLFDRDVLIYGNSPDSSGLKLGTALAICEQNPVHIVRVVLRIRRVCPARSVRKVRVVQHRFAHLERKRKRKLILGRLDIRIHSADRVPGMLLHRAILGDRERNGRSADGSCGDGAAAHGYIGLPGKQPFIAISSERQIQRLQDCREDIIAILALCGKVVEIYLDACENTGRSYRWRRAL